MGMDIPWPTGIDGESYFVQHDAMTLFLLLQNSAGQFSPWVYNLELGGGWKGLEPFSLDHRTFAPDGGLHSNMDVVSVGGSLYFYSRSDGSGVTNFFEYKLARL